eukprot:CCRYP_013428-RA/>CCRYP_013428-RA protein AED:0.07 eAED:0.07 QI:109/0.88/0.8/1/0.88/0.8/10/302/1139
MSLIPLLFIIIISIVVASDEVNNVSDMIDMEDEVHQDALEINDDGRVQQQQHEQLQQPKKRITLLGLDEILRLEQSLVDRGIFGLSDNSLQQDDEDLPHRLKYQELHANDLVEDSFFDPFALDPSCLENGEYDSGRGNADCWHPPSSTVDEEFVAVPSNRNKDGRDGNASGLQTLAWGYGGNDPDDVRRRNHGDGKEEQTQKSEECSDVHEETSDGHHGDKSQEATADSQCKVEDDIFYNDSEKDSQTSSNSKSSFVPEKNTVLIDKHWGSDPTILRMRDRLRGTRSKYWDWIQQQEEGNSISSSHAKNTSNTDAQGDCTIHNQSKEGKRKKATKPANRSSNNQSSQRRPPVFLLPGLASTRLVSWRHKPCPQNPLLSDIKMLDYVWLNMNLLIQMATIDVRCWSECMTLGKFQRDYDDDGDEDDELMSNSTNVNNDGPSSMSRGCKLRPDEGLDAISSLAPGSISSSLLVGGTNTVYAWLIQWLADNLGYDVSSMVALPYDWRLSPDMMEERDGFLTMTRSKIEAAVKSNGLPGIMVAHSMGNAVFRYFQEWLRVQMREEAYERYVRRAEEAAVSRVNMAATGDILPPRGPFWRGRAWVRNYLPGSYSQHDIPFESKASEGEDLDEKQTSSSISDSHHQPQDGEQNENYGDSPGISHRKYPKLWELAKAEGDRDWVDWLGKHIWTYVGLAAPLLGAPGPLRSVLSGENMGLPFTDEEARILELSFGSTSTVNPISTKMGFCDGIDNTQVSMSKSRKVANRSNLACLDELVSGIEGSSSKQSKDHDPWKNFPALRLLLKDRVDFDSGFPMIRVEREYCQEDEKSPCKNQTAIDFGPADVMSGQVFDQFSKIWKEANDPLKVKYDQLRQSWWNGPVPNPLMTTPERPHIKHVIMAYGCEVPTEAGYIYRKTDRIKSPSNTTTSSSEKFDGVPSMSEVIWEEKHGRLISESKLVPVSFTDTILRKKKPTRRPFNVSSDEPRLHQSGDGTIPYISLMWAHTWLLHATRAMRSSNQTAPMKEGERISNPNNALESIKVSHRPKGGNEWIEGYGADPRTEENMDYESRSNIGDTGTQHPHGTKYKPKMVRFQSSGKSRSTGMEYTTTVIEAIGVEHKETTRNYDILAAAFTDVLKNLNDDYGLI